MAIPAIGHRLYRPVRAMTRPDVIDVVISPAMSGNSSNPELVADAPVATWRNKGRKTIAPNIAPPNRNERPTPVEKTRPRKSRSGRIGSALRCSHHRNSAVSTAEAAKSPTIVDDPHGYSLPPHTRAKSSVDTDATSSPAPA